ncbi:MAG: hypothetical protein ACD_8C00092G0012 [uncultured bacterium]|nr:MAG: hypothetical protein ACD_8C00092G0012 [uncultured bacterium]
MKNLIESTIKKIKDQQIKPEPKWKYLSRKGAEWFLVGLVIVLGAVAVTTAFTLLTEIDWDLHDFLHQSGLFFAFTSLPYFWLLLLVFFAILAFLEIRKTENGYRFGWGKILGIILVGIFIFSAIFSFAGYGRNFNRLMKSMPYYEQNIVDKENQWMRPEKGLLAGTILSASESSLSLEDLKGKEWIISIDGKTQIRPMANIAVGEKIKIIGNKQNDASFVATEIRPWVGAMEVGGHACRNQKVNERVSCFEMKGRN